MTKFCFIFMFIFMSSISFAAEKIVFIGDSLTAGFGIEQKYAFPNLIGERLKKDGLDYEIINGGVSGATSASGKSRVKWFLKVNPKIIVLELGANDGLRGLKIEETEKNLSETIELAQKNNIKIILAGMQIPPNYGEEYIKEFEKVFPRLAKKYGLALIPFMLKDTAGKKEYNIPDGIHPNKEGHQIISDYVYSYLKEHL